MGIPASLFLHRPIERPKEIFCPGRPVHSVPGGLEFPPCSLCPDLGGLAPPLWKSPRDRAGKPPHNQRTAKNRRFFDGHGNALLGVENHRRTHSRFVGIPKGSPFGASFSILSVRAESMAPGGRRRKVRFASGFRRAPSARFLAPPFPSKPTGFAGAPFRCTAEKGPQGAKKSIH